MYASIFHNHFPIAILQVRHEHDGMLHIVQEIKITTIDSLI